MLDASIISLIALGGAALFGLQGSISLAVKYHLVRELQQRSACDRVAHSKEANIANIPVAYGAVIFYGLVLFPAIPRNESIRNTAFLAQFSYGCSPDCDMLLCLRHVFQIKYCLYGLPAHLPCKLNDGRSAAGLSI